jgi:hypothetical protein
MDPSEALLFAASGAVLGLVGRILYDWLKNPRGAGSNGNGYRAMAQDIAAIKQCHSQCRIADGVAWLKDVHAKTDANGLPLMYFPSELKTLTQQNNQLLRQTNMHLGQIKDILAANNKLLDRIDRHDRDQYE